MCCVTLAVYTVMDEIVRGGGEILKCPRMRCPSQMVTRCSGSSGCIRSTPPMCWAQRRVPAVQLPWTGESKAVCLTSSHFITGLSLVLHNLPQCRVHNCHGHYSLFYNSSRLTVCLSVLKKTDSADSAILGEDLWSFTILTLPITS